MKTYSTAFEFIQPNIVIFLGDLFDAGVDVSETQFKNYVKRFYRIFKMNKYVKVGKVRSFY